MSLVFQKTKEDFLCEHCGKKVYGNGYTNHCPYCLWSKHVDINPGDRAGECKGMMEPIRVETKGRLYRIVHQCIVCKEKRVVDASLNDSLDTLETIFEQSL